MNTAMKLTTVLLSVVLIFGCNSKNEDSNPVTSDKEGNVIMPLKVENYWNYKITNNSGSHESQIFISEKVTVSGYDWFKRRDLDDDQEYLYTNKNNGLYYKLEDEIHEHLICKYPINVGEIWEDSSFSYYPESGFVLEGITTYKLESKNEKITVPAGTFDCYYYSVVYNGVSFPFQAKGKNYYKPDVGRIKEEYILGDTQSIELISYNLE